MASASCPPLTTPAAVARNLLESRANEAYQIYAYERGDETAWAGLPERARQAWREVVKWLDGREPECPGCHETIWCHRCGGDS